MPAARVTASVCLLLFVSFEFTAALRPSCEEVLPTCVKALAAGEQCPTLPIPESALPVPLRGVGYNIIKLRRGVYAVTDGGYFFLVLKGPERLVVVDAPLNNFQVRDADTGKVNDTLVTTAVAEIAGKLRPRVIEMVYSHEHTDHIGASNLLFNYLTETYPGALVRVWAAEGAVKAIAEDRNDRRKPPQYLVREKTILNVAPWLQLELIVADKMPHSGSDMFVHVVKGKRNNEPGIVHFVDVVFNGWGPPFGLAFATNAYNFFAIHDEILDFDFEVFVGGHLTRVGTRQDVMVSKSYAKDLLDIAEKQFLTIGPFGQLSEVDINNPHSVEFGNFYLALNKSFQLMASNCASQIIEKYGCVLAAIDLTARQDCQVALGYFFVDN